jgi:two-component system sensor histidine kinase PilS (NtrC family)
MSNSNQFIFGTQILSDSTPREGGDDYWRALLYLNIYRMLLAVFLVTASLASFSVGSLGSRHPEQFAYTSFTYAFLSLLFAFFIHTGWPRYIIQCRTQILTDIIIAIILYHTSTGRGAGLEILLFISVSASGILLGGRAALAAASAATILLILEHFYVIATNQRSLGGFTTLGFIGSGLFITAFIIYYLSLVLRKTEVEIAQQNLDLQKMSHVNELIIEQLHSGVIVVDQSLKLILVNQSARKLLDISAASPLPQTLEGLLPDITLDVANLEEDINGIASKIRLPSGKRLLTRYKPLGDTFENGFIILLDDYSQIEQDQRNEKFIAMGRLSASIAHEIRNPLGAISHAGQLLAESPSIINKDNRLVEIIENQSQRINQIVKTILELGQTKEQKLEKIPLHEWLERIINNFIIENDLSDNSIVLNGNKSISACGDPEQLQHVILNLLSNSLRYADADTKPFVEITIDEDKSDAAMSSISISNNGPGITEDIRDKIFEPFFTTSSTGHGLGLYIARKICLSNHGRLDYYQKESGNSFFRLTLASNGICRNLSSDSKQE